MKHLGRVRLAIVAGLFLALEVACRTGWVRPRTMPPPSEWVVSMVQLLGDPQVLAGIAETLGNVLGALAAALAAGFAAGLALHAAPRVRRALDPLFATWYAIPLFIFYPVLIGMFGVSRLPILIMGFGFGVVAVVISTLAALDREPRVLVKLSRVHRLGRLKAALHVRLPAAAPHLFVGVKLAVAYSFISVIACEFLLSDSGLGHAIAFAYNGFDNDAMYGLILLAIVLVIAVNWALNALGDRLARRHGASMRGTGIGRAAAGGGAVALVADAALVAIAILCIWQVITLLLGGNALASPWRTFALMGKLVTEGNFWLNVVETIDVFGRALVISYAIGIGIGIALGCTRTGAAVAEPMLVAFYALPKIVLLPIVLLIFGLGVSSKIAFGALHSAVPIALITMGAIANVRAIHLKLARSLRLGASQRVRSIIVPSAMPEIVSAMRVGFSLTLLGVLIGEMFASKRGLGYMIMNSIGLGDTVLPIALALFLFVFALAGNGLLLVIERRLVRRA